MSYFFQLVVSGIVVGSIYALSALGFGMGNYNDILLEQLGDKGNGHYAYIDTLEEAKALYDYETQSH